MIDAGFDTATQIVHLSRRVAELRSKYDTACKVTDRAAEMQEAAEADLCLARRELQNAIEQVGGAL